MKPTLTLLLSFVILHSSFAPAADWPQFTAKAPKVLELGEHVGVRPWPNYATLDLLRGAAPVVPAEPRKPRD